MAAIKKEDDEKSDVIKQQYMMMDRFVPDVLQPPAFPMDSDVLFDKNNNNAINIDALTKHLNREGRLTMKDALYLIHSTRQFIKKNQTYCDWMIQSLFAVTY